MSDDKDDNTPLASGGVLPPFTMSGPSGPHGNYTVTFTQSNFQQQQGPPASMGKIGSPGTSSHYQEFRRTPLVAGSLIGIRVFEQIDPGRLKSISFPYDWHSGLNDAECRANSAHYTVETGEWMTPHKPGAQICLCGFYAYHAGGLEYFRQFPHWAPIIGGIIQGMGTATVGSLGFRCEKARIIAIFPFRDRIGFINYMKHLSHFPSYRSQAEALDHIQLSTPIEPGEVVDD